MTVEHDLTQLGRSLADAVGVIRDWAYGNMGEIEVARDQYDTASHVPIAAMNAR